MSTINKLAGYSPAGQPLFPRATRQDPAAPAAIPSGGKTEMAPAATRPRPWTISAALVAAVVGLLMYAIPSGRGVGASAGDLRVNATQSDLEVRQGVEGETKYVALTLYDSHDEDGDVIELSLPGGSPFSSFVLTNQGHRVLIPMTAAGTAVVMVKAVHDGSQIDKVSFGANTSAANVSSRIMAEGEVQTITVTVGR